MEAFSERKEAAGAGNSSLESLGEPKIAGFDQDSSLRFATSAGVIFFNPEGFMGDVVNSVNDLILGGFDSMEEFAAKALDFQNEEPRCALQNGLDKIYNKVQDNIDEHLSLWESSCRTQYFNWTSDANILNSSDNAVVLGDSRESASIEGLQEQDELLNKELCSLRSQLIKAERDASRMRREKNSLGKKIALRSKITGELKNIAHIDDTILEDIGLLQVKIKEASSLVPKSSVHPGSKELGHLPTQAADIKNMDVDPRLLVHFLSQPLQITSLLQE